jgi:four helix bundle protein
MKISNCKELEVITLSFANAMKIYHFAKIYPQEERYSLTDQIIRSSRSVSAPV